jgi:hypothetical protein
MAREQQVSRRDGKAQRKATATALDSGLRRNDSKSKGNGNSAGFRPAPE